MDDKEVIDEEAFEEEEFDTDLYPYDIEYQMDDNEVDEFFKLRDKALTLYHEKIASKNK